MLTVNPETPPTFRDFMGVLEFIGKESWEPPDGLLTDAALLPPDWEIRLIDLYVSHLCDVGFQWADFLLLGGGIVQRSSFLEVARRCRSLCTAVVACGPLITTEHDALDCVDHLVIGEEVSMISEPICDALAGKVRSVYDASNTRTCRRAPSPGGIFSTRTPTAG